MQRVTFRSMVPIMLLASMIILGGAEWDLTRRTATDAINLWWTRLVPIMFPGFVLGQALGSLWPRPRMAAWMILAFFTFPPVVAVSLVDLTRQGRLSPQALTPLLLYTNLANPLLFPHPRVGLFIDAAALLTAILLVPRPIRQDFRQPMPITPRRWIIDAMNWTSILGFATIAAWLIQNWLGHGPGGWLVEPMALHWKSGPTPFWAPWAIAFGGVAYWIAIFWAIPPPHRRQPILYHTAQALLAGGLVIMMQRITL